MTDAALARALLAWYRRRARDLPWRRTRDPYAIWLSEVMLQQTTVETVTPRYRRFLARFPTVEVLAAAHERDVLAEWSGLGYYARAKNLHRSARRLVLAGGFPRTVEGLRALPGVGAYTAAAVASIAFGVPEPVVDGNVVRVLCRLHGLRLDPKASATLRRVRELARPLVSGDEPGDRNQALMELGALVCTPRAPRCGGCPFRARCRANALGAPERYPRRPKRKVPTNHRLVAGLARRRGRVLLVKDDEIVRGHLTVPLFRVPARHRPAEVLRKGWNEVAGGAVGALEPLGELRHSVLDRRYVVDVFAVEERTPSASLRLFHDARPRTSRGRPRRRILRLRESEIARHEHGGLLRKILALGSRASRKV